MDEYFGVIENGGFLSGYGLIADHMVSTMLALPGSAYTKSILNISPSDYLLPYG